MKMETYPFNVLPFFSEPAFSGTVRSWENSLVLHHFGGAVMKYDFNRTVLALTPLSGKNS